MIGSPPLLFPLNHYNVKNFVHNIWKHSFSAYVKNSFKSYLLLKQRDNIQTGSLIESFMEVFLTGKGNVRVFSTKVFRHAERYIQRRWLLL